MARVCWARIWPAAKLHVFGPPTATLVSSTEAISGKRRSFGCMLKIDENCLGRRKFHQNRNSNGKKNEMAGGVFEGKTLKLILWM